MALRLAATITVLALLVGLMSQSALALFTHMDSAASSDFTRGTLKITALADGGLFTLTNMAPGDQVTEPITVTNAGTPALRYAVTSTTTEDTLAAQLDLTIWDEAEEGDAGTTCNSTAPASVLYGPAELGSTTGIDVIGDATLGAQRGDRTLAAGASEVLCFRVSMPLSWNSTSQNLTTVPTYDFHAEQTANNP